MAQEPKIILPLSWGYIPEVKTGISIMNFGGTTYRKLYKNWVREDFAQVVDSFKSEYDFYNWLEDNVIKVYGWYPRMVFDSVTPESIILRLEELKEESSEITRTAPFKDIIQITGWKED
jgi:hypothetical protein